MIDALQVEDGLTAVYEDLVLSDVLLGDCNVLGINSEGDAIQRMTDTVFNNSDDESLLPELKPEFLDFVTQGTNNRSINGGSRISREWGCHQPQIWGARTYHSIICPNISGDAAVIIEISM